MKLSQKKKAVILAMVVSLQVLYPMTARAVTVGPKTAYLQVHVAKEYQPTPEGLVDVLYEAGFRDKSLKMAWSIVMKESHGHATSHNLNPSTGDDSYGLFQINMVGSLGADRRDKLNISKNSDLLDPLTNAKAAFYMSAHGTNFGSWGLGPDAYDGDPAEPSVTNWLDYFPMYIDRPP